MGSGIAAHLANIGFNVTLLEQTREHAEKAFARAKDVRPPHFYSKLTADQIRLGGVDQDLEWIREADWVCEAIIEKLDAKRDLFEKIEPFLKADAFISTNTSGLQIELLSEGRTESFRRRFLGTHFFNPPRYLKLLELIPTNDTDPEIVRRMTEFLETDVARRVVLAKDTPGFIANRYGMWSMIYTVHVAEKLGLSVEEVDAITGPFLGRPKSASFRLNDIVGLDIMVDIAQNLIERCPEDPQTSHLSTPKSITELMEKGWIGGKAGQGYYKKEGNQFVTYDLVTGAYRERLEPNLPSLDTLARKPLGERLRDALQLRDEVGEYLREYLVPTLQYAVSLKEEISHNVRDFDRVMQWGFGWEAGPFEMIDAIGAENLGIQAKPFYANNHIQDFSGSYFAPAPEPLFAKITDFPIMEEGAGWKTRDLGDGVTAFTLSNKMGVVDPEVVKGLQSVLDTGGIEKLLITSEAKVYSAGFDLKYFVNSIENQDFAAIDEAIAAFHQLNNSIGKIPSVAAVWGFCLGGGFEVASGCTKIVAAAESMIGLPEARVGLVPGGLGTLVMHENAGGEIKRGINALKSMATGAMSSNADHAKELGYLTDDDVICYHPDQLITFAKQLLLSVEAKPRPDWKPFIGPFGGMVDQMQNELKSSGELTDYDELISDKAKRIFTKATSREEAMELERTLFVELCREGRSLARMKHMLETGKPLRN